MYTNRIRMKGNIKALLDLHISVGCLIFRKLALFHEKKNPKKQNTTPLPHTHKTNQKDNVET